MATYRGSYIASAYRARIDCTVADKSGDSTKSVVTVKVYVEMASGAKDGAWNFKARGAIGADSPWSSETTGSSSTYLNGTSYLFNTYTREYSKTGTTQSVMCYGQVRNTYTSSWAGPSDARGTVTIPALTTYAVTYYANKPTGASGDVSGVPSAQSKANGIVLTLTSATPTLADYVFTGWNTEDDGTGTSYAPGDSYTGNATLDLYAQWEPLYVAPTVSLVAYRSDSSGNPVATSTTHVTFIVSWATTDSTISSLRFDWGDTGGDRYATPSVSGSSATGTTYTYAASSNKEYDADASYQVTATVTDSNGMVTTARVTVPPCIFPISFGYGGQSVGIGALASSSAAELTFGCGLTPVFGDSDDTDTNNATKLAWRVALGANSASNLTTGTLARARLQNVAWTYLLGNAEASNFARWTAIGRVVIVQVFIGSGTTITTSGVQIGSAIGTSAYRPDREADAPVYHASNNTGCMWVTTDGKLYVNTRASSSQTTAYGTLVYRASS